MLNQKKLSEWGRPACHRRLRKARKGNRREECWKQEYRVEDRIDQRIREIRYKELKVDAERRWDSRGERVSGIDNSREEQGRQEMVLREKSNGE
jgi:hypothetical protein